MSGIRSGSRLDHLRELRVRIDDEIAAEEDQVIQRQRRAAEQRSAQERAAAAVRRSAENAYIANQAPADRVRAWARAQGRTIGTHGRIALALRMEYLADLDSQEHIA